MKRLVLAAAALCFVATSASAMTVAEFLAKANALKAKGMMAAFSSDIGLLKSEMAGIAAAYRADIESARAAGRKPHSCPPPKGQTRMTSTDLLAELENIPVARRGMSMKAAFYAIMLKRYPCR
ncbi:MAG: hypothetical protein KF730_13145 [Sphingomonas sp.]|uniref:hypothetical protein n=1 Tax=Sphingomonas sp. TaxID=28214 RepID=UPI0025FA9070|nr:hypothetical protein [Sphingomonas sp.]MBX3565509.1 hypothetical protein [Sphingomonas sp.]